MPGANYARIMDPQRTEHFVYRLLGKRGRVLYIGCTMNIKVRLSEHRRNGRFGTLWHDVEFDGPHNYETARRIERDAILEVRPPFNSEWRPGYNRSTAKGRAA